MRRIRDGIHKLARWGYGLGSKPTDSSDDVDGRIDERRNARVAAEARAKVAERRAREEYMRRADGAIVDVFREGR